MKKSFFPLFYFVPCVILHVCLLIIEMNKWLTIINYVFDLIDDRMGDDNDCITVVLAGRNARWWFLCCVLLQLADVEECC